MPKWLALVLILLPVAATAQTVSNPISSPVTTTSPTITANPIVRSRAASTAAGGQGGQGGQSTSGASANPSAGASSGSSTVTFQTGNNSPFINQIPSDQIVRTAPTVYVPSVSTGNVCALGASAGGSWIAASFAFGMSWESMQCERRQAAALLWNMNTPESRAAAKEVICNTPEIRAAYAQIGSPCAADLMRVAGVPAQQKTVTPAPQTIVPQLAFDPAPYVKASECLTAAQAQGAPLSLCAGKQ
jgi:hypothetical protein